MKCISTSRACQRSTRAFVPRPGPAKYANVSCATRSMAAVASRGSVIGVLLVLGMMPRMRVHSIDAIPIDIPLKRNFGGSTYAVLKRSTVITRLATDAGVVSEVYNGDNREHGVEIARLIREELAPRVRGFDVFERERIWTTLFALSHA